MLEDINNDNVEALKLASKYGDVLIVSAHNNLKLRNKDKIISSIRNVDIVFFFDDTYVFDQIIKSINPDCFIKIGEIGRASCRERV